MPVKLNLINFDKIECQKCSFDVFCSNSESIEIAHHKRYLKKNEILHIPHDRFKNLYAIKSGALKTYETDPVGNEIIHGIYLKNEIYGYEAIYSGEYFFTSVALSETIICEISYQTFMKLLQSKPELLYHILYLMSQRQTFGSYVKSITAQQKLAAFLLDLLTRLSDVVSNSMFLLPMTYQDIGNYLGLATETVSRIFSQFKKNKLIAMDKKYIHILQVDKLRDIAEGS